MPKIHYFLFLEYKKMLMFRLFTGVIFRNSAEFGTFCGNDIYSAEFRGIFYCLIPRTSGFFVYGIPYPES
jgi:hypothetical protein